MITFYFFQWRRSTFTPSQFDSTTPFIIICTFGKLQSYLHFLIPALHFGYIKGNYSGFLRFYGESSKNNFEWIFFSRFRQRMRRDITFIHAVGNLHTVYINKIIKYIPYIFPHIHIHSRHSTIHAYLQLLR